MRRSRPGAALLGCLLACCASAGSLDRSTNDLPEIGPPPQGEAQWVAKSMRHNGLPMTLKAFHSRLSAAEVLRHYENNVARGSMRESMRSRNDGWEVLAIKDRGAFITIQARDVSPGSVGTLAVTSNPARKATSLQTRFPLPKSLRVVTLQQYEDEEDESEHISLISSRAPHIEAASCAELLRRERWSLVLDAPARTIPGGYVIEAQKGAEHTRLTFLPNRSGGGGTAVVIVWRKA